MAVRVLCLRRHCACVPPLGRARTVARAVLRRRQSRGQREKKANVQALRTHVLKGDGVLFFFFLLSFFFFFLSLSLSSPLSPTSPSSPRRRLCVLTSSPLRLRRRVKVAHSQPPFSASLSFPPACVQ